MPKRRHNRQVRDNSRAQAQRGGGLGPPSQPVMQCKKAHWELTITVKTSAKYGHPAPAVSIVFNSQIDGKDAPMDGLISSTVRWRGNGNVDTQVHAAFGGWTGDAKRVQLSPGAKLHVDLELKGTWVEFLLVDAGNPPAPVKDEKARIYDEKGKFLEDRTTNDQGVVRLENVAPQQYQISFTGRYDFEWKPY